MGLGRKDSRPWHAWSPVYRQGSAGEVITTRGKEFPVRVVAGVFSAMLEPGVCILENPDGKQYTVTIPVEGGNLWDIIDDAEAFPPDTAAEALAAAVTGFLEDNPVVTMQVEGITNAGTAGKDALLAETQADARAAIGAGTSNLAIGTTGSTAKAGNWAPAVADLSDASAWVEDALTGTPAEARDAIEAVTLAESLAEAQARIAAWAGADAYIDFTNKPDGDPPSVLDTGQAVDFVYGSSDWKPRILDGKLLTQATLPGSNYADYYQATLDEDCHAFGTRFTVDTADGSTQGIMCIAVWAGVYQTQGTVVPHSPAHITIDTTAGGWQWWVNGPGATYPTSYLKAAKTGTFTPPASDGDAVWEVAGFVDAENGIAYLYLPGPDVATGSRIVTVTDAEIAASMTAQSVPVTTLAACLDGANVVMVEHQANVTANTAIMPRFLDMWGETRRLSRDRGRALRVRATVAPAASAVQYAPTTQQAKTIGTSTTIVYTDTGNTVAATVTATAGPTGRINFRIPAVCIEFGGSTSRSVTDGAITAASTTLTSATAAFVTDDVGRQITVFGAGPGGSNLTTTIASRTNGTTVVLSDAADTTVASAGKVRIYTPTETIIYGRLTATGGSQTTPFPDPVLRGRAGERWTGPMELVATGQTPNSTKVWTFSLSRFSFGDGSATIKFGGSSTAVYPSLNIHAMPS